MMHDLKALGWRVDFLILIVHQVRSFALTEEGIEVMAKCTVTTGDNDHHAHAIRNIVADVSNERVRTWTIDDVLEGKAADSEVGTEWLDEIN